MSPPYCSRAATSCPQLLCPLQVVPLLQALQPAGRSAPARPGAWRSGRAYCPGSSHGRSRRAPQRSAWVAGRTAASAGAPAGSRPGLQPSPRGHHGQEGELGKYGYPVFPLKISANDVAHLQAQFHACWTVLSADPTRREKPPAIRTAKSCCSPQDSIKSSRDWFLACRPYAAGMAAKMAAHLCRLDEYDRQLHVLYLANDILLKACAPWGLALDHVVVVVSGVHSARRRVPA